MRLFVGQIVRLVADVRVVPPGGYEVSHGPGVKARAGEVAIVLNSGPLATYLRGQDFEGWLYHHEHDPASVFTRVNEERGHAH